MTIQIRQSAGNSTPVNNTKSLKVTFSTATRTGSLIVFVASARSDSGPPFTTDPSGFTRAASVFGDDVGVTLWFMQNAPSMSSVTLSGVNHRSLVIRAHEVTGAAQANALDKVKIAFADNNTVNTGSTGTISQADEILFGAIVNQHASTTQFGFTGGLARLSETVTSATDDPDEERHRLTVHAALTSTVGSYALGARLSAHRDWAALLVSFRGGSLGPARMTSKAQVPAIKLGGRARLSAFGPMRSKGQGVAITITGRGWIGPFERQFLLGGRGGLLIGAGTDYRVESAEGIGGWEIRSSDSPFPREDGDQRGVDLQAARQILFRVNFHDSPIPMEQAMQRLLAALRPQRNEDWELIYRLPGMPLQAITCRPMSLTRELNTERMIMANQAFALRAADPRIYSSRSREITVPVSESLDGLTTVSSVINIGNANAYPVIQITNTTTTEVTGIELVNVTGSSEFTFSGILPSQGTLIADMPATVTSEPRSKITVNGQPTYGSWVAPREPFFLSPDPDAPAGVNAVYLRTTPANTPVRCILRYRDTWSG